MQWCDFVLCGIFHANGINSLRALNKAMDQNDKASRATDEGVGEREERSIIK